MVAALSYTEATNQVNHFILRLTRLSWAFRRAVRLRNRSNRKHRDGGWERSRMDWNLGLVKFGCFTLTKTRKRMLGDLVKAWTFGWCFGRSVLSLSQKGTGCLQRQECAFNGRHWKGRRQRSLFRRPVVWKGDDIRLSFRKVILRLGSSVCLFFYFIF